MSSYPASIDTLETLLVAANNVRTRLSGAIGAGTTDILVQDASAFQANAGVFSIGTEVIKYTTKAGNLFQGCTRGFDATTAAPHQDGETVDLRWVAAHHNGLADAIRKIEQTLGVSPQASSTNVATRLSAGLPATIAKALSSDWSFTHDRRRIVAIQLWRKVAATDYEQFFAPIQQELNPSGSATVTILLTSDEEGFIVIS